MQDKNVDYYLFSNKQGAVGIGLRGRTWSCPFAGMVAFKITEEQSMKLNEIEGIQWLSVREETYKPFLISVKGLKELGINIGRWWFGFFGEVTPKDDEKLLMLQTDSGHLIWLHFRVE